jgi:hypothetical protein
VARRFINYREQNGFAAIGAVQLLFLRKGDKEKPAQITL